MEFIKDFSNFRGKKFKLYMGITTDGLYYLLAIPDDFKSGVSMAVQSYNSGGKQEHTYKENVKSALFNKESAIENILPDAIEDAPILMPITPDIVGGPDCQQLSKESVQEENMHTKFYNCIDAAKKSVGKVTGKVLSDKIFLYGYSASGVFAQRFAFIYPELIDRCLIGGAAGSIPVPLENIDYPIGIRDYEELFGKKFNETAFRNIQYGYFVAENEEREDGRYDINGDIVKSPKQIPAAMHDMSFRAVTTPKEVGKAQREVLGQTMNERYKNSIDYYKKLGINISAIILRDADHRAIYNDPVTRSSPYLKGQIVNFYYRREPLKTNYVHCVKNINPKFQETRERIAKKAIEEK